VNYLDIKSPKSNTYPTILETMKYALVHGNRTEATKGANGICPNCGGVLIAKCGEQKINHWAHKAIRTCDSWWEPETEWHRSWKNEFPTDWQEKIRIDETTGERHIADVATDRAFVVEFQHSHIHPDERIAREAFYKNMVWVVDGTRKKRDSPRLLKARDAFIEVGRDLYRVLDLEEVFPIFWIESRVPVVFDFLDSQNVAQHPFLNDVLYCLFPTRIGRHGVVAKVSREIFIQSIRSGQWKEWTSSIVNGLELVKKEHAEKSKVLGRQKANAAFQNLMGFNRVRRRRF
jgi:competence protein CoiA